MEEECKRRGGREKTERKKEKQAGENKAIEQRK